MLEASGLCVSLPDHGGKGPFGAKRSRQILFDVGFTLRKGSALGLVGESGSGKTTVGRALVRLIAPTSGQIRLDGEDFAQTPLNALWPLRRRVQIAFQDSLSSLNPRRRAIESVAAPLVAHRICKTSEAYDRARELLSRVGLPAALGDRYPHQLSGGQRQRVNIARALSLSPSYLVADEIFAGLDLSVQRHVIEAIKALIADGLGLLLISHDLAVVRGLCDEVAVMSAGRIVEFGRTDDVYRAPKHPYTIALLRAIPTPVVDRRWLEPID